MDDISCDNCRGWRSTAKDLGDEKREAVRQLDAALERVKVMEAADHEVLYPPRMMEEVSRFVGAMPEWKKGSPVNIRVDEREDLRCQLNAALSHVAQLRKALDELLRWAPSGAVREQCEVALAIQAPKADTVDDFLSSMNPQIDNLITAHTALSKRLANVENERDTALALVSACRAVMSDIAYQGQLPRETIRAIAVRYLDTPAPNADTRAAAVALAEACDAWWDGKPHNGISLNIDMQQAVSAYRAAKAKEDAK